MKITSKQLTFAKVTQTRVLAFVIALTAAWTGLYAIDGKAELSASLVKSLPPAKAQLFPMQKSIATITASQAGTVRKAMPKQAPKLRVVGRFTASITSYNSDAAQTDSTPDITADGTRCVWGVAAGPYNLPFGTKFQIPSLFPGVTFVVHDRSATPYGHVDIWMKSYHDSIQFGRRTATVEILG
jgi:3D (Asp-Asp-Asp) domain-containing protein